MRITRKSLPSITYDPNGPNQQIFWDEELPGFGVRVYPTGKKSFVIGYRFRGSWRILTLGKTPPLSFESAYDAALDRLEKMADGIDPKQKKHGWKSSPTVQALCETYLREHAPRKKTEKEDQRRIERHILPAFGSTLLCELTRAEVRDLHERIGKTAPYEANRTIALLRAMWNLGARDWDLCPPDRINPAEKIRHHREVKRKRYVRPHEVPALATAIEAEADPYVRGAIWIYLLTGTRKMEFLCARRRRHVDEPWVDWEAAELVLPDPKGGDPESVPLSAAAMEVLRTLPVVPGNPYVFAGHVKGHHLVNISKPWDRIRKAAGCPDLRLHDLRRTVGSWMSEHGEDLNTVKTALRHADIKTTLIYAHLSQAKVREAMEGHAERMKEAVREENKKKPEPGG